MGRPPHAARWPQRLLRRPGAGAPQPRGPEQPETGPRRRRPEGHGPPASSTCSSARCWATTPPRASPLSPCRSAGNSNVQVATDRGRRRHRHRRCPPTPCRSWPKGEYGPGRLLLPVTPTRTSGTSPSSPAAGPPHTRDLKGLNIGVSDFGGTEYPVTRNHPEGHGHRPRQGRPLDGRRQRRPGRRRPEPRARSTRSPITTPASASSTAPGSRSPCCPGPPTSP